MGRDGSTMKGGTGPTYLYVFENDRATWVVDSTVMHYSSDLYNVSDQIPVKYIFVNDTCLEP
jgi:hypothetical protein